jgi:hypothetical protein
VVLAKWLAPASTGAFVRDVWRRRAWARPGIARDLVRVVSWQTAEGVLSSERTPDVLVVAGGALLDDPAPRSLDELRRLMRRGIGVCIRHAERHDDGLAGLTCSLANDLPGAVQAQVFVTPGGTHGFGWHYDAEDVFIAQTAGTKDYFFRENTVESREPDGRKPDFTRFSAEVSPLQTARLIPGDVLYIPARWWHMAVCIEDSLSLSMGHLS